MTLLPPLKAVWYFESAARHLNFSKAAAELNVTHSAISHQIRALEDWVGQPLFERGARGLRLTETGQQFLPPVRVAFQQLMQAGQAVRQSARVGPLTVSVLPSLASKWLVPRLSDFRQRYPDIDVRISATGQLETVGRGDIDVGIRYGRGKWSDLEAELLQLDDLFPICSPSLLKGPKPLREPRDIANFPLLSDNDWRPAEYEFWSGWFELAGISDLGLKPDVTFTASNLMIDAAIGGLGIGLGNTMLAGEDIKAGRLVKPFDLTLKLETGYFLVYGQGALRRPKIKAFRDWVFDQMAGLIDPMVGMDL